MTDLSTNPQFKKPEQVDPVARSIANPNAFAKPGTPSKPQQGVRFRPLSTAKRSPGRPRTRKPDRRFVRFF